MKIIYSLIISLIAAIVSANACFAKEWRGVVPLLSTRADVEQLLGAPKQSTSDAFYYSFPDEIAVVWFQTEPCDSHFGKLGIGWNVPIGTVTNIGVIPKLEKKKEAFIKGSLKAENANAGFAYYTDEIGGLSVETFNEIVTGLDYTPLEKEDSFRCPRIVECCADFFSRFDEYENLSFEKEKEHLDNFAIVMKERLYRGVVVVYGESRKERSQIMKRAERSKRYLVQRRGIEAQRVLIVDGGYRKHSVNELALYPIGGMYNRVYVFSKPDPEESGTSTNP